MRSLIFTLCLAPLILAGCRAQSDGIDCTQAPINRAYFDTPIAEQTMDDILANIVICLPEDRAVSHANNIGANADEKLRDLLAALYRDDAPDTAALAALRSDINLLLRPNDDRFAHTTVLNEAVRQQNFRWVQALLTAGADPNGSGSLMAYTVLDEISHPQSPWNHLFRDGSPAVPFLQLYIDAGGTVNTTEEGGFGNIPLLNKSFNNLAARVFLLQNGADGWLHEKEVNKLRFGLTTFGGRIGGARAPDYNEEMYLLVDRGLYKTPKEQVYADLVHDKYLAVLQELADATGPTDRHHLWTLQKVLGIMIDKGLLSPSDEMRNLLASNPVPDAEGGWVLTEGALHQPYDDPRNGAVLGSEVW